MSKSRLFLVLSASVVSCAAAAALVVSTAKEEGTPVVSAAEPEEQKMFCSDCKTPTGRTGLLTAAPKTK